ncbi:helix-turn-helix transcriptional regulator [Microbulbifer salipaludis]|uniref:Helix-turn-helix transcriptional regulator n=1 Tax=Microbulbifer salipaludis TaxID=187980 RepID=A0ABS3E6T8_9GAMM|nr:AraC family transcriptional regulator [Microbulbifer salipaludis]MBN8431004.1 helix-turn-helix transcriptional regulator [Microbulbifer salipaludis]
MDIVLFNTHDIVIFVTIYLCLLFAVIAMAGRHSQGWRNVWLSGFLLSQAFVAFYVLALWGEGFHSWVLSHTPWIFSVLELALWVEGPLLLLYVRSVLFRRTQFQRFDLILVAPVAAYLAVFIAVHLAFDSSEGPPMLQLLKSASVQQYEDVRNLVRASFGGWALWTILRYERHMSDVYSNVDLLSYRWLKILVLGFIGLRLWTVLYLTVYLVINFVAGAGTVAADDLGTLGLLANYGQLLLISGLLYYGLGGGYESQRVAQRTLEEVGEAKADNRQAYSAEQVQRLSRHMAQARPYLNSNLRLEDLAHQVSLSSKLLSNLINREFGCNFFEYVNRYRLAEVKAALADPEQVDTSVLDLALRAGYNSKTTFNRLFKLDTGVTPSQFRKTELAVVPVREPAG